MSSSKQVVVATVALALLLHASHLAAGAEGETVTPLSTCETPICVPCWGKNQVCIAACVALRYTGGFCNGDTCVCTKQCLAEAEAVAEAGGPSPPPVQPPPLGKRGMGMLK
ncbi:hypothetical protein ZEAMMB73_Zm00001d053113 [Zea mays]|uniref:Uncharacterized protein n=2 Tax=Zea mays TaxID=4577 RepID=K7UPD3_MAIZE|nr:hypothetical protein ZEAMMB73_Zm00001d053113 [Zea mays]|eukprot:XP_008679662.2 uncharacterized protein LOC103654601 [Zea mays]